jgi:chorismate lyase
MTVKSRILSAPPQWHAYWGGTASIPIQNQELASWVLEPGSLTQRLRKRFGPAFTVRLLQQRLATPFQEEKRALQLQNGNRVIVREVALMAGEQPVILARSVLPEETIQFADPRLGRLGTQPLGDILFSRPDLQRLALQWTKGRIKGESNPHRVVGRRSLYLLGEHSPLLVAEFFMPPLFEE